MLFRSGRGRPRSATPCNHDPTESPDRIERARLASTRNVAWKASSASWRSPSTARQTLNTIGPCRDTRAAKAASAASACSPRRAANRPTSSWSLSPVAVPASNKVDRDLGAIWDGPLERGLPVGELHDEQMVGRDAHQPDRKSVV